MKTPCSLFFALCVTLHAQDSPPPAITDPGPPPIPAYPAPETVAESMKRAGSYFRSHVAFAGGYAWRWSRDLGEARAEGGSTRSTIALQPPGTPTIGLAFLEAYRVTEDKLYLQAAKEAAQVLAWCQTSSGGWRSEFDFDPRKAARYHYRRDLEAGDTEPGKRLFSSTLDDNKSQSAMLFLLELAHAPGAENDPQFQHLRKALDFALDGLLASQAPNGGWGQHFSGKADPSLPVTPAKFPENWPREYPGIDYTPFYTLNDGNLLNVMRLLIRAHELEQNERYLKAAKRLGEFLLLAQLPDPQPTWAQQYNFAMEPAWARKFEPPAACSLESVSAMRALFELWLATGERRFVETLPAAFEWFERSRLDDGRWARFYELQTNRPLYCQADTYEVTYDDSDLPTHYGFKIGGDLAEDLDEIRQNLARKREDLLAEHDETPQTPAEWTRAAKKGASKVRSALKSQKKEGVWLNDEGWIDARPFVTNLRRMAAYVEAATRGGDDFREIHEKALAKTPVRVAGVVLKWVRGDKEANWDRAKVLIREAAANGAEIVVTTECFLDGYAIADKSIPLETFRGLGEPIPGGKFVKRLMSLADELDIHLIAGMLEADGEERFNAAVVFSPNGALLGKYRKQHMGHEADRNSPGTESTVFTTPIGDLGVMICADRRFPEIVDGIVENGANLLLCLSGGMFGPEKNDPIMQARSKETGRHIVFVHPAEFLATRPDGSISARKILGDRLLVAPEEVDTEADSRGVFYIDVPR